MKLIATVCLATLCSVAVGAQSDTRVYKNETDKNKAEVKKTVEIKDGQVIKAAGCVIANPAGGGYLLTNVGSKHARYTLVTHDDMSKYLQHRVWITGTATNREDGQVRLQTTTKLDNHDTKADSETKSETKTTTTKGGSSTRFLGVDSVDTISNGCK